ncbi:MAG: serine/threonine protein kinase [Acidobacteria bacterium]|nr:serine/threonine protein kinase [Acidobacteriota bacterium]
MSVDPRWQRVQQLLEILEDVPVADQQSHLTALEPDASLREEVLGMIAAMRDEQSAKPVPSAPAAESMPSEIGPYQILRKLGSGGCSVVYLGSRTVAGMLQQVAIKVLRENLQDAADLARFKWEQGILARLDHPAIARFLDAGADSQAKPYLVMEYVDGEPIDSYCRRLSLGETARLRLIASVLDALHVAHQNLVVHLDLKPSNIMVDRRGAVKIVDFGTAKLLENQTDWTTTRQLTPSYASPEQLRGEAVSTLSDLYSIGLTLQELVSEVGGVKARASLASIAERAYGRNSIKTTSIRRDLDAVVFKALESESRLRYQSAADFAADLRAIVESRPVIARKPTLQYKVGRFVARIRGGVSLVAMLVVALLIVGGYSLRQYT